MWRKKKTLHGEENYSNDCKEVGSKKYSGNSDKDTDGIFIRSQVRLK